MELARIGKYEIVSRIGQGAMGEVYKAHDPVLNRFVAVKTMTGVLTADDELVDRFRREAQSAARLNHVNSRARTPISGKAMRSVHQTFRLVEAGPGWTIQTIGQ